MKATNTMLGARGKSAKDNNIAIDEKMNPEKSRCFGFSLNVKSVSSTII